MARPSPATVANANPAYFIAGAARALECMNALGADPCATVHDVQRIAAEVHELGQCWAMVDSLRRPDRDVLLNLFTGWLDLEQAFLAGEKLVSDWRAEDADLESAEAEAAAQADEVIDARLTELLATVPGLAAWCRDNPRAAHSCRWFLFDVHPRRRQIAVLNYLVRERIAVVPGPRGGAHTLSSPAGVVTVEAYRVSGAVSIFRAALRSATES